MAKPKMKSIPLDKVTVGMQVVVNDLPDAFVYLVDSFVNRLVVKLYYLQNGQRVEAGLMDYSVLRYPTKIQLENAEASK